MPDEPFKKIRNLKMYLLCTHTKHETQIMSYVCSNFFHTREGKGWGVVVGHSWEKIIMGC